MLEGYIDDSGSEPSSPTFVLAGYVLPAHYWASFSDEWTATLSSGKPIPHLHMKDLGAHVTGGVFDGWDIAEKETKLLSLARVIQKFNPVAISAHSKWAAFRSFAAKSQRSSYIRNPYKALLHEITRIMCLGGLKHSNPNNVDFIFDEQGEIGSEATSWWLDMKEAFPPDARKLFGKTPTFENDEHVMPLQAADMFAWFYRRRLTKPVVRPAFLQIEKMISEGFLAGSDIDSQGFENAARDFEKVAQMRTRRLIT